MPSVGLRVNEAPEARVIGIINHRHCSAYKRSVEELVALFAGGFSNEQAAMASRSMGRSDVEFVVWIVLRTEGVIAAQLSPFKCAFQVSHDPLARINQASKRSL